MMRDVFEDLDRATYVSFADVIQINHAYQKVNGHVCKGFWLEFADPNKQEKFIKSSRYQLYRVEV